MWNNLDDLNKKILIDSDVIRHFIRGRQIDILKKIFTDNLYILSTVEKEISRSKKIKPEVIRIINNGTLKRMRFPTNPKFMLEYAELIKRFGEGESACMAVARYDDDIIASNNLNDIKEYCNLYKISYLTTIDILFVAYKRGIMNEADVDYFLYFNITGANPSKIPFPTLAEFISTKPAICDLYRNAV
ncbi:MAG: hypothetical protein QM489_04010 [Candidatus Izemoplasma sp.]